MKKTVLMATVVFWSLMIALVIAGRRDETSSAARVAPPPAAKTYTLKDVARHAVFNDCWMAIHGQVYDFSAYLPQHPAPPRVHDPPLRHASYACVRHQGS